MRTSHSLLGALAAATLALLGGCRSNDQAPNPGDAPGGDAGAGANQPGMAPAGAQDGAPADGDGRGKAHQEMVGALVQQFMTDARAALEKNDLEKAHESISHAYELDPGNPDVSKLYDAVSLEMGARSGTVGELARAQADTDRVRRAQARLEVENKLLEARQQESAGDLSGAIRTLEDAALILRWNPYLGGGKESGITEASLRAQISALTVARSQCERNVVAEREQRAMAEKTEREREERERQQNLVDRFLSQANDAFYAERYKEAAAFCDQVLALQPNHTEASELKQTALEAFHAHEQDRLLTDFKDHWRQVFDELDFMNVPVTDDLTFPSAKEWNDIATQGPVRFRLQGENLKPEDQRIWEILNNQGVELNFEDTELQNAIDWLRVNTGVNFIIDQAVLDAGADAKLTLRVGRTPAKDCLDMICNLSGANITYVVRDGVVRIITNDQAKGGEYIEFYDVRDLINKIPSFPSTDFDLTPSGSLSDEEPPEDTAVPVIIEGDALRQLITNNIEPTTWEGNSAVAINLQASGALVVRQTSEVHRKIDKLLHDLRAHARTLVNIQTRFLSLEDRFLQDIGVDLRGLNGQNGSSDTASVPNVVLDDFGTAGSGGVGSPDNPVGTGTGNDSGVFFTDKGGDLDARARMENLYDLALGDQNFRASGGGAIEFTFFDDTTLEAILRAVEKSSTTELIHAPNLTVFNGQRAHISVLNHISYVKDFEVEIAQGAVIADPIVAVLRDGPTLDVRPVVSADRRFVTVEVRPTLLDLIEPIGTFRTSLAVGNEVELQLPELQVQRLRTTVTIPDGATLMLGGMKTLVDKRLDSGIPFLKDIPLISFLASRKGTEMSKRKVMILVRAKIIIAEENEPPVTR